MAASATTAATNCILRRDLRSSPGTLISRSSYISFTAKSRKFQILCSGEATTETEETPVEVQQGVISSLNVAKALRGLPITEIDHYGNLGVQRGCSYEDATVAYKRKVEEMSKESGIEEEELRKRMEVLKESHSVLTTVQDRRLYDWSLARIENGDTYVWPFEVDISQKQSPETPPAAEPENEEPTKLLGYFIVGWLVLSFVTSVAFNL